MGLEVSPMMNNLLGPNKANVHTLPSRNSHSQETIFFNNFNCGDFLCIFCLCVLFAELGFKLMTLHVPGECPSTELHSPTPGFSRGFHYVAQAALEHRIPPASARAAGTCMGFVMYCLKGKAQSSSSTLHHTVGRDYQQLGQTIRSHRSWAPWVRALIPTIRRLRQGHQFEDTLSYKARLYLKNKT